MNWVALILSLVLQTPQNSKPNSDVDQIREASRAITEACYEGDETKANPWLSRPTEQQAELFKEVMLVSRSRFSLTRIVFRTFGKRDADEWWIDHEPSEQLARFQDKLKDAQVVVNGDRATIALKSGASPLYVFHRDDAGWRLDLAEFLRAPDVISDSDRAYAKACRQLIPRVEKGEFKSARDVRDALTKLADKIVATPATQL